MDLSIIIPCYNEEEGINHLAEQLSPVLKELRKDYALELIFVDDGSTDNTNALLNQYFGKLPYVKILKHEKNRNLGAAVRTGFFSSTGNIITFLDSDCTYPPKILIDMLKLLTEDIDIVVASPLHPDGKVENVPEYRLFLSKASSWMYRKILSSEIYTPNVLVKVYRRKVLDNITFESNDYLAITEILVNSLRKGYRVIEYPTTLKLRKYGTSKIRLFTVIKSHFVFLSKLFLLRISGKLSL